MGLYVSAAEPALTEKSVEKDVRNHMPEGVTKRDRQKKRFIDALTAQGAECRSKNVLVHVGPCTDVLRYDSVSVDRDDSLAPKNLRPPQGGLFSFD